MSSIAMSPGRVTIGPLLEGVQKRKLGNGLTVLLKPDRRAPVACVLTWVNVGYFNEPDELAGISHFIEHMFFKGTPSRGVGAIAQETKALGGYLNAATIYDYTYYYTVVPKTSLTRAIDIQADALLNPLFDEGEMEREKEVIIQELKRKYDNPDPYAWEKLVELAFDRHRIRRWRMGREADIRSYRRDAILEFYRRYYSPENVTLVLVGDFEADAAFREVERRYGEMPSRELRRETSEREPPQRAPRMSRLTGDVTQALVKIGFHAPSVREDDHYPLTFLSVLLGRGRSSRLFRSLKEEKGIVDGIGASYYASYDVGYFTVEADLKPENIAACEEEIWMELDRLRRDPPSPAEVDKIRNIVEVNFFAEKEDAMGQAYSLAYFESLGGYEKLLEYVHRMRSVTPADLVGAAGTYFTFANMSLLEYVPKQVGEGAATGLRLESLQKRVAQRIGKLGGAAPPARTPPPAPIVTPPGESRPVTHTPELIPLDGGVKLLHLRTGPLPLVSIAVCFPGGRLDETADNCGISQFALRTSIKGTERRTADEIAFGMESLGASIRAEASADLFGYSMGLLSRDLEAGLDLLSDVILRPTFPAQEIERERAAVLAALRRNRDDMFHYPIELFYEALYGNHPYGLPRNGTEETVARFAREQLLEWYASVFRWGKMVVCVVGDVEAQRAVEMVRRAFGVSGDADEASRAQIIPVVPARGPRERAARRERAQTGLALGFPGVSIRDDRYFALEVLRNVLSGMAGRLFLELRERRALAYTVTAFNIGLKRGGAFFTYVATSPEKEAEARDVLLEELTRVGGRKPPTEAEMETAKAYTRGSHAIALQGNMAVAYEIMHHYMAGRGVEAIAEYDRRIESVNAEQVRLIAQEVLKREQCAQGIVRGKPA